MRSGDGCSEIRIPNKTELVGNRVVEPLAFGILGAQPALPSVSCATLEKRIEATVTDWLPDDETLIGYLLGSLEPREAAMVAESLEHHEEVALRLAELAEWLEPWRAKWESEGDLSQPPSPWLIDAILAEIAIADSTQQTDADESFETSPRDVKLGLREDLWDGQKGSTVSWVDCLVGISACVVLASLLVPGVLSSRQLAKREGCSANLRSLGMALASFSNSDPNRRIPSIDLSGPLSFSGMYAVRLHDQGLLEKPQQLWCPSVVDVPVMHRFPFRSEQLKRAAPAEINFCRRVAGGTYAFNLGFVTDGVYATPQWNGQSHFAILADAPMFQTDATPWFAHGSEGINILFDDGHVSFIRFVGELDAMDDPFFNRKGYREAGLDRLDSSLGASPIAPFQSIHAAPLMPTD